MAEKNIEIEAETLEEARAQVESQIPEGLYVLSQKVLCNGKQKTVTGIAETLEGAFEKARKLVPSGASVLKEKARISPSWQVLEVEARDEKTARTQVGKDIDGIITIDSIVLKTAGERGFLGIGKKPNIYEVKISRPAVAEVFYKPNAKIRVEIGEKEKVSSPKRLGNLEGRKPRINRSVEELKKNKDVDGLISALTQRGNGDIRADAAFALGDMQADERAVKPLIRALEDEDFTVVVGAAKSLGEIHAAAAVEPLIQVLLNQKAFTARVNAAVALGEIKDTKAVAPLIQTLKEDKSQEVRVRAAWALRQIKDVRAIQPLIEAMRDDEDWDVRGEATGALSDIGEPAVGQLIEALKNGNEGIRGGAIVALGHIGDRRAIEPLSQSLEDKIPSIRDEAEKAIQMIKKTEGKEEKKDTMSQITEKGMKVEKQFMTYLDKEGIMSVLIRSRFVDKFINEESSRGINIDSELAAATMAGQFAQLEIKGRVDTGGGGTTSFAQRYLEGKVMVKYLKSGCELVTDPSFDEPCYVVMGYV